MVLNFYALEQGLNNMDGGHEQPKNKNKEHEESETGFSKPNIKPYSLL